jgi:hypothetical protein
MHTRETRFGKDSLRPLYILGGSLWQAAVYEAASECKHRRPLEHVSTARVPCLTSIACMHVAESDAKHCLQELGPMIVVLLFSLFFILCLELTISDDSDEES